MTNQLHLLRPFARWTWRGKRLTTVGEAGEYVQAIRDAGFGHFYTATFRRPTRERELQGGSVYFVKSGVALFRMPFIRIEDEPDLAARFQGRYLIVMEPELILVVSEPGVGFCRGWRYLQDRDKPPDLQKGPTADVALLDQMGFVK